MKQFAICVVAVVLAALLTSEADAQWVRRYYRPIMVAPAPVVRVYRQPMVVYQPTTVFYSRRRPILGGYSVRPRRAYRRSVVW